eukprot:281293-Prymnesium_polylepis.2
MAASMDVMDEVVRLAMIIAMSVASAVMMHSSGVDGSTSYGICVVIMPMPHRRECTYRVPKDCSSSQSVGPHTTVCGLWSSSASLMPTRYQRHPNQWLVNIRPAAIWPTRTRAGSTEDLYVARNVRPRARAAGTTVYITRSICTSRLRSDPSGYASARQVKVYTTPENARVSQYEQARHADDIDENIDTKEHPAIWVEDIVEANDDREHKHNNVVVPAEPALGVEHRDRLVELFEGNQRFLVGHSRDFGRRLSQRAFSQLFSHDLQRRSPGRADRLAKLRRQIEAERSLPELIDMSLLPLCTNVAIVTRFNRAADTGSLPLADAPSLVGALLHSRRIRYPDGSKIHSRAFPARVSVRVVIARHR